MALVPFIKRSRNELARLHEDVDELFNRFFGGLGTRVFEHKLWPAIDIADNEDEVVINAEVPGCKADDIDISVHGNTLTTSGKKRQEQEEKGKGYYHVERCYGSFRRDLNIPADVDPDNINAVCKNGVLTITLPKAEKTKTVKVKVREQ